MRRGDDLPRPSTPNPSPSLPRALPEPSANPPRTLREPSANPPRTLHEPSATPPPRYDCELRRDDLVHAYALALTAAVSPASGSALDATNLLALEALLDLLAASGLDDDELLTEPAPLAPPGTEAARRAASAPREHAPTTRLVAQRVTKERIAACAEVFNHKPAKGITALVSSGLIRDATDAHEVARFLRSTPQLSKNALGDYLSGPEPFCNEVPRHAACSWQQPSTSPPRTLREHSTKRPGTLHDPSMPLPCPFHAPFHAPSTNPPRALHEPSANIP